jgi:hypothetical protein
MGEGNVPRRNKKHLYDVTGAAAISPCNHATPAFFSAAKFRVLFVHDDNEQNTLSRL